MSRRRTWWVVYGVCAAAMVLALAWISAAALRLEQGELLARADAARQNQVRLALWRMDSWLAPRLLREASRPHLEYRSFKGEPAPAATIAPAGGAADLGAPSPLLAFRSDLFPLHFEVHPDGVLSSPQAPRDERLRGAAAQFVAIESIDAALDRLDQLEIVLAGTALDIDVAAAEVRVAALMDDPVEPADPAASGRGGPATAQTMLEQAAQSRQELSRRQQAYVTNASNLDGQSDVSWLRADGEAVRVGPLVALWTGAPDDGAPGELLFVRRVTTADGDHLQGVICDWPTLRASLQAEIDDLLPAADLIARPPSPDPRNAPPNMLATVPVSLEAPPAVAVASWISPLRTTIAIAWLAVLGGLAAAALTLRATVAFGEKRSRFASSVTHELRTPLTTFCLYTEMLVDGMVTDDAQRQSYLRTLYDEARRLSRLVENVISYARLEDGRRQARSQEYSIESLLHDVLPPLERRAADAGMTLTVQADDLGDEPVTVDGDAIGQILFNLVDNACKYARNGSESGLALEVMRDDRAVRISVRDGGPGIASERVREVFAPFERGRAADGDEPGMGLGLTLSRGLARDLGGDLDYEPAPGGGACFVLTIPTRPPA